MRIETATSIRTNYDWLAYDFDDVHSTPIGRGTTEEEAIVSFVRHLCEDVDWPEDTTIHSHRCQQCDTLLRKDCPCKHPGKMDWFSVNCRAAHDL